MAENWIQSLVTANAGEPSQGAVASLGRVLGPGNTALIVTGLMLPAGGALARTVALFRIGDPINLGVTLPGGELAAIGFMPVGLVAIGLLGAVALRRQMRAHGIPFRAVVAIALLGIIVITASTGGDLLQTLLSLVVTFAALWLANRESSRPGYSTASAGGLTKVRAAEVWLMSHLALPFETCPGFCPVAGPFGRYSGWPHRIQ